MAVSVVDASALAALLFGEPQAETVAELLRRRDLYVPTLLRYEIGSVGLKKCQLHPHRRTQIIAALQIFEEMAIQDVQVGGKEVVQIADRFDLTYYDAAYLWLADYLNADLVTLDQELARAWQQLR